MTQVASGLERFASDLPHVGSFVTLGEGDTALLPIPRIAQKLGLGRLSAKMESLNPTGSYKDRVAAMSLSLAREQGKRGWIATSSGNAGMSMAAYGSRTAIPGFLCLVATAPHEKRLALMPYAVELLAVEGIGTGGDGAALKSLMDQVTDAAHRHDLYLGVTANMYNPDGMRGIDTISYELAEQAPDATHVYVPTGGGGLIASIGRGLENRGMPAKLVACQPAGCAPIVHYLRGDIPTPVIDRCDSEISALQLPHPPDGLLGAKTAASSGGWGTAIDDAAILAAQRILSAEGIFVEPASAASLAALMVDIDEGRIDSESHPVLILTGAGWKDLSRYSTDARNIAVAEVSAVAARIDSWLTRRGSWE